MKLADSNLWLALTIESHTHHDVVSRWLMQQPADSQVVFCRSTQTALLRLLTTRAVLQAYGSPPLTNEQAWQVYVELCMDPRIGFADEPTDLELHWKRLSLRGSASPKLWMDAYLAAFAIAGGHQLVTIDAAFTQFTGLNAIVLSR